MMQNGMTLEYNPKYKHGNSTTRKIIQKNLQELVFWIAFGALVIVGYKFFSDGSFSAILTLSSAFQCFGFFLLTFKVNTQATLAGISVQSLIMYGIALSFRLVSTLFFNGYLPVDRSGDWVYQAADCLSLLMCVLLLYWSYTIYSHVYNFELDKFPIIVPIIIVTILAIFVHPDLNSFFPADFAWTFALYVETLAMIPQLFLMTKIGGEVEALTSHYIACVAASRFFAFVFWLFSFRELAPHQGNNIPGWAVMISFGAQILMLGDFLYAYVSSLRVGKALIIPSSTV